MNRCVMYGLGMSLCFLLACGGGQSTSTVTAEVPTAERQQQDSSSKKRSRVKKLRSRTKVRGSLSKMAVFAAIDKHMGKIQRCYEKELLKGKKISGKLNAAWTITISGEVKNARIKRDTIGNPRIASCLIKVLERIKFPPPKGGEVVVVFPFVFAAR